MRPNSTEAPAADTDEPRPWWSSERVSQHLDIPLSTLDEWAYKGKGPVFAKLGRYRRYRPDDVERWAESQLQPRGGAAA